MSYIAIVDLGGSTGAVMGAITRAGATPAVIQSADGIAGATHVVLPGVGAFGAAVAKLGAAPGLREAILGHAMAGKPLLGICLGAQLLLDESDESEGRGLGLIPGRVEAMREQHVGWDSVDQYFCSALMTGIRDGEDFYFAHGYVCYPEHGVAILARTADALPAVLQGPGVVYGVQFHPEKSGRPGDVLLRNFLVM